MEEEMKLQTAKKVFDTACIMLDEKNLKFESNEEKLSIKCIMNGKDLPVEIMIHVDAQRQIVELISKMPFIVSEDKRIDLAVAVTVINDKLSNGCFDYDVKSGCLAFHVTNSFLDSELGRDALAYMFILTYKVADDYNDKLFMIAKDLLPLDKFMSDIL